MPAASPCPLSRIRLADGRPLIAGTPSLEDGGRGPDVGERGAVPARLPTLRAHGVRVPVAGARA